MRQISFGSGFPFIIYVMPFVIFLTERYIHILVLRHHSITNGQRIQRTSD
jgi:hypothetical protein